jgi:hypothetical protein
MIHTFESNFNFKSVQNDYVKAQSNKDQQGGGGNDKEEADKSSNEGNMKYIFSQMCFII